MNYFLLSICCVLISSTVGHPAWKVMSCNRKVDNFLGGIKLDESVQKLVKISRGFRLDLTDFAIGEYTQFNDREHKDLMAVGYKESCHGVLEHFTKIEQEVDCFEPGSILKIDEDDNDMKNMDVIWAALACSYTSRWRPEGRGESAPFYDFLGFSEAKTECLDEMATALDKVRPDANIENVIELNRGHKLTVFDIRHKARPIDKEYISAFNGMFSEASCEDLHNQIEDAIRGVYCVWKHISNDGGAQMKLRTMGHAGEINRAHDACQLRISNFQQKCRNRVAKDLGEITLDEEVEALVQHARANKLTHVHFAATKYKPLDDERHGQLSKIKYPKGCDGIVKHFSELGDRVKCTRNKSFDFMREWMQISKIKQELSDKVLAGWACAYASKFDKERPETTDIVASEPFQPVEIIEDEEERKRLMDTLANFNIGIRLDASLEEVVEIARGCKYTFVDFVLSQYQPLDEKCSEALLATDSWKSCEELNNHTNKNHPNLDFYQKEVGDNSGVFIRFLAIPDSEQKMLADEACEYIRKHGKEPKSWMTSFKSKLKWWKK